MKNETKAAVPLMVGDEVVQVQPGEEFPAPPPTLVAPPVVAEEIAQPTTEEEAPKKRNKETK